MSIKQFIQQHVLLPRLGGTLGGARPRDQIGLLSSGTHQCRPVRQRLDPLSERALGVEVSVRIRNRPHEHGVPSEPFDLESGARQQALQVLDERNLRGRQAKRQRKQEALAFRPPHFEAVHGPLEQNSLMRGVLVYDEDAVARLGEHIGVQNLPKPGPAGADLGKRQ